MKKDNSSVRIVPKPLVSPETFQQDKPLRKGIGVRNNPDLSSQADILGASRCCCVPFLQGGEMAKRCCSQVGGRMRYPVLLSGILGQISFYPHGIFLRGLS